VPILTLSIQNFRNIERQEWELSPGLNVLEGENAQGKTNLLESLYFLANGRSFRTQEALSLIRFGSTAAQLQANIGHGSLTSLLEMNLDEAGKKIRLQGKALSGMATVYKVLRVLIFTPESTALFRSAPSVRRRYFDLATGVHRSGYSELLGRYARVLRQRNRLLEQGRPPEELEPFDHQWAELVRLIMAEREEHLRELLPLWQERLAMLAHFHIPLSARWEGRLSREEHPDEAALLRALRDRSAEERRYGRTVLGPNRDDLAVYFGSQWVREVASQGQQRILTIALKLAEADLFAAKTGLSPIFLLDDVGSELDLRHMGQLLEILAGIHAQTVLTTARSGSFASLRARTFRVEAGRLLDGDKA
jgi:DNA replication and repair protein RecF